jgi:predicted nucleic acid-binding protein
MILVDSGVLIDFLRTKDRRLAQLFQTLPVATCGVIRAEILAGARGVADRQRLIAFLAPFHVVPIQESIWDAVGDTLATLGGQAITVPLTDVLIATLAIANNLELWQRDHHFLDIQRVLPALRLFQEPP